jgi:hypothetical protein
MRDYTWLNTRKFHYGVLASNDQITFTGKDGIENEEIPLEIEILEGE